MAVAIGVLTACSGPTDLSGEGIAGEGPEPPSLVQASPVANGIDVSWSDESDDEIAFRLFRYRAGTEDSAAILLATLPTDTEQYLDESAEPGQPYGYQVQAVGPDGESIRVDSNAPVVFEPGDGDGGGDGDGDGGAGDGGGRTIEVTTTSTGGSESECDLVDAIEAANADQPRDGCPAGNGHDAIVLQAGAEYLLNAVHADHDGPVGLPSVTSGITIEGNGARISRASDAPEFRLVHVSEGGELVLIALTLENGVGTGEYKGGGLYVEAAGSATAEVVSVRGNRPTAVFNGGTLNMADSEITGNGGVPTGTWTVHNLAVAHLENVTIADNDSAGIYNEAQAHLELFDSVVSQNRGDKARVGAMVNEGYAYFRNTEVTGNNGYDGVSGILNMGELLFEGGQIRDHLSTVPGGGLANQDLATLRGTVVQGNTSMFAGGGITSSGVLILEDVTVFRNTADSFGGGIYSTGETRILGDVALSQNESLGDGGGVYVGNGSLTVEGRLQALQNLSRTHGGGIYVTSAGGVTLKTDTVIRYNQADADGDGEGQGGGAYVEQGGFFEVNGASIDLNEPDDVSHE